MLAARDAASSRPSSPPPSPRTMRPLPVSNGARFTDQLRPTVPKLAALMDTVETDVLAYMTFPTQHRAKLHSTNPLERLNGETKRRTEVVGIFPNEAAITGLVGAIMLEQSDMYGPPSRCKGVLSLTGEFSACGRVSGLVFAAGRPQAMMVFADRRPSKWSNSRFASFLGLGRSRSHRCRHRIQFTPARRPRLAAGSNLLKWSPPSALADSSLPG